MKQFKRFILLVLCIGCFSSTLLVSAGSNSRTIYNSQKTVKAYSKASYSKATIKDHLKISAEINGGCDASKIEASNSAYYKYKPGGGSYSGKYKFWYANSANGKYKIKKKYASATIFINLDDVEKTYAVFE